MLETLITSKTRLRLLIKFFVAATNKGYLNGLAQEFGESTNAIRKELNHLASAGYLSRIKESNKIQYLANTAHPLFTSIQKIYKFDVVHLINNRPEISFIKGFISNKSFGSKISSDNLYNDLLNILKKQIVKMVQRLLVLR